MGWNKENRPAADFFPTAEENPTPGGTITPGGAPICVDLCIASGDSDTTLTNQISGLSDPHPRSLKYDTTAMRFIRVVIDDVKTVGASTARLIAKYANTKADALAGTFAHPGIGATEVAASIAALGPSWTDSLIELDPAAIGDVLWHIFAIGGDGTLDPVYSGAHIQFFTGMLDPCAGGGCPMPAGIYNGEDFSVARYADEAAFLAFAEAESDNRYSVWYGDDGSVEGVSYDPDLTFCGNPVAVGRWVAVSSGSPIWDVLGYGNYTQFSNPVGDTGGSGSIVAFRSVWTTMRIKIEAGWTADDGYGFTVSDLIFGGNGISGEALVLLRDGRVIFRYSRTGLTAVEYDVGAASLIVGTSDFVEITIHGVISDLGSGVWQVQAELFINPACSGGSAGEINTATPLQTHTDSTVVPTPIGGVVNNFKFYDWDKFNFTADTAQWPEKKIWVAQWFYSGSLT